MLSTAVSGHQTHVTQRLWTQTELSLTRYDTAEANSQPHSTRSIKCDVRIEKSLTEK